MSSMNLVLSFYRHTHFLTVGGSVTHMEKAYIRNNLPLCALCCHYIYWQMSFHWLLVMMNEAEKNLSNHLSTSFIINFPSFPCSSNKEKNKNSYIDYQAYQRAVNAKCRKIPFFIASAHFKNKCVLGKKLNMENRAHAGISSVDIEINIS